MGSDRAKNLVRRLFQAFDAVDTAAMDELFTSDFVAHGLGPSFSEDLAGWKQLAAHWAAGFSDERLTLEDFIAEGDKVAVRWTTQVRHTGEVFGLPASNRTVSLTGIDIYRIAGNKCAEYWGVLDLGDLSR